MAKSHNEHYHVYILFSPSDKGLVKVGKANNITRVKALVRMCYANRADWRQIASFPVNSDHDALALEAMINAKLSNQGLKIPRTPWINRINGRPSYADECFSCEPDHAVSVAHKLSEALQVHILKE